MNVMPIATLAAGHKLVPLLVRLSGAPRQRVSFSAAGKQTVIERSVSTTGEARVAECDWWQEDAERWDGMG